MTRARASPRKRRASKAAVNTAAANTLDHVRTTMGQRAGAPAPKMKIAICTKTLKTVEHGKERRWDIACVLEQTNLREILVSS